MAEVVGTLAAALQLTEAAWKLKKLCSSICNAPKDLSDLVEEVVTLADLLADIEQRHTVHSQTVADVNTWKRCHKLFEASVAAVQDMTSELELTLGLHKLTGRIRLYLKQDELKKYSDRMERVKTTMIAAQQSYSLALLTQQNALLLQEIRSIAIDQQSANQTTQASITPASGRVLDVCDTDTDVDARRSSEIAGSRPRHQQVAQTRRSYAYNFRLPAWIYRKGLSILIEKSNTSWGATLWTYNRLPRDAAIFEHVRNGRWDDVRLMFDTGCASTYDVDEQDFTLLDHATSTMDYGGCEFLLQCGRGGSRAWKFEDSYFFRFALHSAAWHMIPQVDTTSNADRLKALQRLLTLILPAVRESMCYDSESYLETLGIEWLPFECAKLVINALFFSYESRDVLKRAELAMRMQSLDGRTIRAILGEDQTLHQAFELLAISGSDENHRSLLRSIAYNIGTLYDHSDLDSAAVRVWIEVLAEAASFEATTSTRSTFLSCILGFLSSRSYVRSPEASSLTTLNQVWTAELRIWVRILKDLGVDLELYGRAEKATLLPNIQCSADGELNIRPYPFRPFGTKYYIGVGYMAYGSEIDDWEVWIVPGSGGHYEMAGAFWNFVENPELVDIPGAFVAADEDILEWGSRWECSSMVQGPCM